MNKQLLRLVLINGLFIFLLPTLSTAQVRPKGQFWYSGYLSWERIDGHHHFSRNFSSGGPRLNLGEGDKQERTEEYEDPEENTNTRLSLEFQNGTTYDPDVNGLGSMRLQYQIYTKGGHYDSDDGRADVEANIDGNLSFVETGPSSPEKNDLTFIWLDATNLGYTPHHENTGFSNNQVNPPTLSGTDWYGALRSETTIGSYRLKGALSPHLDISAQFHIFHNVIHTQAWAHERVDGYYMIDYKIISPDYCSFESKYTHALDLPKLKSNLYVDHLQYIVCTALIPPERTDVELTQSALIPSWSKRGITVYPKVQAVEPYFFNNDQEPLLGHVAAIRLKQFWTTAREDLFLLLQNSAKQADTLATVLYSADHTHSIYHLLERVAQYYRDETKKKALFQNVLIFLGLQNETPDLDSPESANAQDLTRESLAYLNELIQQPEAIGFEEIETAMMTSLILSQEFRDRASIDGQEATLFDAMGSIHEEANTDEKP